MWPRGQLWVFKTDVTQKSVQVFCLLLNQIESPLCSRSFAYSHSHSTQPWILLQEPDGAQWEKYQQSCGTPTSHWAINSFQYSQRKWVGCCRINCWTAPSNTHSPHLIPPAQEHDIVENCPNGSDWIHSHNWSRTSLLWSSISTYFYLPWPIEEHLLYHHNPQKTSATTWILHQKRIHICGTSHRN